MKLEYNRVFGKFVRRVNRFIAHVIVEEVGEVVVHVMNTGRLKELLVPGAEVMLSFEPSTKRKTAYDLRMVKKDSFWVSIDSQLPNKLVEEGIRLNLIEEIGDYDEIRRESVYGNSRFDFKIAGKRTCFIEVKGVTLENKGWGYFPDAPTERGKKHIEEMITAVEEGYRGIILFLIQHPLIDGFTPNKDTDPIFTSTLEKAQKLGVELLAYKCSVTLDEIIIQKKIPIIL